MKEDKHSKVVLLYKRNSPSDEHVLEVLETGLGAAGCDVFVDRHLHIGIEWAREIESQIRSADSVVVILSDAAAESEMLQYEVETAADERQRRGRPFLFP